MKFVRASLESDKTLSTPGMVLGYLLALTPKGQVYDTTFLSLPMTDTEDCLNVEIKS